MIFSEGHFASSRSLKEKVNNLAVYTFLKEKLWKVLFHIKIAYYPRMCHELSCASPKSFNKNAEFLLCHILY